MTATATSIPHIRASIEQLASGVGAANAEVTAIAADMFAIKVKLAAAKAGASAAKYEREQELAARIDAAVTDRLIEAAKTEDVAAARAALNEGANPDRSTPVVEGCDLEDTVREGATFDDGADVGSQEGQHRHGDAAAGPRCGRLPG